jgi:Pyruvate/2-oxoacid:ferredoxin oxidoreductase delta subunit
MNQEELLMIRKIIRIDREQCDGCGLCAEACHEAAIAVVDGKAELLREDYCDGLGNCLPVCPRGAISFEERESAAYDGEAARAQAVRKAAQEPDKRQPGTCPGSMARRIPRKPAGESVPSAADAAVSRLNQWPVQIRLVPVRAPYFENAHLLISADCGAYACGNFHNEFMKNRITLIGCPKLDEGDYGEKLTEIIGANTIRSVTVVRMEVPCCGGIEKAAIRALTNSGKMIPWRVLTLSTGGEIVEA